MESFLIGYVQILAGRNCQSYKVQSGFDYSITFKYKKRRMSGEKLALYYNHNGIIHLIECNGRIAREIRARRLFLHPRRPKPEEEEEEESAKSREHLIIKFTTPVFGEQSQDDCNWLAGKRKTIHHG